MIRRPRFKQHLEIRVVGADLVVATSDQGQEFLEGRLAPILVPLIDGRRTTEELLGRLDGALSALELEVGLALLERRGWLVDGGFDALAPKALALADAIDLKPARLARWLAATGWTLTCCGPVEPSELHAELASFGVRIAQDQPLELVLTDDYLRAELAELGRRNFERGRSWLLIKPIGRSYWLGPLFRPDRAGCWECLAARLKANRPIAAGAVATAGALESGAAANLLAVQLLHRLVRDRGRELVGRVWSFDPISFAGAQHHVVPRPGCWICSGGARPAPPRFESAGSARWTDGGYRTVSPASTWRRYRHLVSPLTGVVGRVQRYGSVRQAGLSVYRADHQFRWPRPHEPGGVGLRRLSAGKGLTAAQARASALGEALERVSGIYRGDEPRRRARLAQLGEQAIDPRRCLHFSAAQYATRAEWNRESTIYTWVPQPFDPEREIDWTPAWSPTRSDFVQLPTAYCYYAYPSPEAHQFCQADSNGCAAGNTLEEALLQGFLELVERDAVAIWWYNRIRRPGVELDSFARPELAALARRYATLGRCLHLLDLTHDLAIPAFAAVSWPAAAPGRELLLGFGAHFDAGVAVARALTEMSQFLPGALAGSGRRLVSANPPDRTYLEPDPNQPRRRREDYEAVVSGELGELVRRCASRAAAVGLELLIVDQTRADIGLPVVKVVAPDLRHYWARFGPGRLYTVPVALGWLGRPRAEAELNPSWIVI